MHTIEAPNREETRCPWCGDDPLYVRYHDEEWGRPRSDEAAMFEFLILESAQSGLSWLTILRKREGYRRAFAGFDPELVARFGSEDVERLVLEPGIVRHRGKIEAAIGNARAALRLREAGSSISELAWSRVGGKTRVSHFERLSDVPASTPESIDFAREMKSLGFRHFGPVVAYSHMQALGLFDDHLVGCRSRAKREASGAEAF